MIKIIFIYFLLYNIAFANTIFESNKLNNISYVDEIKELENYDLTSFFKDRIFIMYAYDSILVGKKNNIQCNKFNFDLKKFNLIIKSINKYNLSELNKFNVNYIVLCNNLKINNNFAAGFANKDVSTIIIDFSVDIKMLERALHHEVFHIVSANQNTKMLNKNWLKQNNKDFFYKKCSECNLAYDTNLSFKNKGFLSEYSKYSIEEDQAELFSFWMSDINIINEIIKKDTIIKSKIEILKNFLDLIGFVQKDYE